jgi:hypothetical protein
MQRTQQLLEAARAAAAIGTSLEDWMAEAWNAFMEARPGLRVQLADLQLLAQLEELRTSGRIGEA